MIETFVIALISDNIPRFWLAICNLCSLLFLFIWTVIGFLLQEEVRYYGVNNEQCGDVLLGWLIIQLVVDCCLPCCAFMFGCANLVCILLALKRTGNWMMALI